jgi:hypothetical protein
MSTISIKSKTSQASHAKQMLTGANKHFPNASDKLTFGGATYTVSALTMLIQSFVDLREAVDASKAATKAKIEAERAQAPSLRGVISAFEAFVKAMFGNSPEALADFGLSPRKARTPLTAEQKTVAAKKRAATRAARHTMSSKAKKAVKGSVKVTISSTALAEPLPIGAAPGATGSAPTGGSTPHS